MNAKTGKIERVYVDLEAVYPNENDRNQEMSFEELRAKSRGWSSRDWAAESKQRIVEESQVSTATESFSEGGETAGEDAGLMQGIQNQPDAHDNSTIPLDATIAVEIGRGTKAGRPKKMKIKEVKGETQTSM